MLNSVAGNIRLSELKYEVGYEKVVTYIFSEEKLETVSILNNGDDNVDSFLSKVK